MQFCMFGYVSFKNMWTAAAPQDGQTRLLAYTKTDKKPAEEWTSKLSKDG